MCSMISGQCDKLRETAADLREHSTFVGFGGKKKIVKGLQQRLADGEVIGVHAKPIAREVPVKPGEPEMFGFSELCFELDEIA